MRHLQLLMVHAADIAAQGSEQILVGRTGQGRKMLLQAAGMLRRAMSGPEMNAMHQGGEGLNSMMRKTHDLGDSMFNLLELMMKSSPEQASARRWLDQSLAMAAEGTELVLSGFPNTKNGVRKFTVVQGNQLQADARTMLVKRPPGDAAYAKIVVQVMEQMDVL